MREMRLIERLRALAAAGGGGGGGRRRRSASGAAGLRLLRGIGDDCAVLGSASGNRGRRRGAATDLSLENVHFRRAWHPPAAAGHRCLARGLSDIAAMGGEPVAAFLSLALPRGLPARWVEQFLRGLLRLAKTHDVALAGGDVAGSPRGVLADIVVVGSVPAGMALLRSGARAGDFIYVSGALGAAGAELRRLRRGQQRKARIVPQPRLELGRALRGRATACIDLSDGLSTDLHHLCAESGVGAVIHQAALPVAAGARVLGQETALGLALHGGDDYELLFTAPPRARIPARLGGVPLTRIGEVTRQKRVWLQEATGRRRPLPPGGWEHFSSGHRAI
jgi:thiamine-monophosphate kinase